MERTKKTPGLLSGVYLTQEEDTLLKLQAIATTRGSVSAFLRNIVRSYIEDHKVRKKEVVQQIVNTIVMEWEIEQLRCRKDPGREVSYADFIVSVRKNKLKKLSPKITNEIINQVTHETNQLK